MITMEELKRRWALPDNPWKDYPLEVAIGHAVKNGWVKVGKLNPKTGEVK